MTFRPPAIALLWVLALGGCGGDGEGGNAESLSVSGSVEVPSGNEVLGESGVEQAGPDNCVTTGNYSDLEEGTQVVITDSSGKRVGLGSLEAGTFVDPSDPDYSPCTFPFNVADVPKGKGPYAVQVGQRDEYVFKESDATNLRLTIPSS